MIPLDVLWILLAYLEDRYGGVTLALAAMLDLRWFQESRSRKVQISATLLKCLAKTLP